MHSNCEDNYQVYFLQKAIEEEYGEKKDIKIEIDHYNAINYINGKKTKIIFPKYLRNYISSMNNCEKTLEYNFIGTITPKREWINKYKNDDKNKIIHYDNTNCTKNKNYSDLDKKYYETLCKSKFTLTPTGNCPWSYRLFEAIMAMSIPIIEDNDDDIFVKDYYFYYNSDEHIYNYYKAKYNYDKFCKSEHFFENIKCGIEIL